MNTWINNGVFTYILLDDQASAQKVEKALPQFVEKYLGGDMKKFGFNWSLSLTPLKDVYFENIEFDNVKHGDKTVVYIFLSIAALILLIACINFMNLSTIRAVDRSKEVGLRKVLGALRNNLVWQFMGESVLLTTISCIISLMLLVLTLPLLNQALGYSITLSWNTWPLYLFLVGIILLVGFLSGSYPAFFLSAFSPIQALKGKLKLGKGGSLFRQALVVVQFSISVFLIVGTIIITRQMDYVKNKQPGYDKEQMLVLGISNNDIYQNLHAFKTALQNNSAVKEVSMMSGEPGGFFDGHMFEVEGLSEKWSARTEFADFDFVKTLGLTIIAGRDFSPSFRTDTTEAVLINQLAAAKLGWTPEEALGKWIKNTVRDDARRRVIGVVNDFDFQSLKQNMEPLIISPGGDYRRVIVVKLNAGNLVGGIEAVRRAYQKVAGAYPFEYRFLDQKFGDIYKKDLRQQAILTIFAVLAIFVACLGLFGLASFTATKRFKEIGVRKVLGCSTRGIVLLLTKDLMKPVGIAACLALPAGYWAMAQWLQNFAYKTNLSVWVFILAATITFGIALATVGFKAIAAALSNPVKSLRAD